MAIETYRDEHSGITGRSNGSKAGNAFIRAMNEAQQEQRKQTANVIDRAREAGAKMVHVWCGWFRLESNDWQSGDGAYEKGSRAKFCPAYPDATFGLLQIGDFVLIRHGWSTNEELLMWKVAEIEHGLADRYVLVFDHKLT